MRRTFIPECLIIREHIGGQSVIPNYCLVMDSTQSGTVSINEVILHVMGTSECYMAHAFYPTICFQHMACLSAVLARVEVSGYLVVLTTPASLADSTYQSVTRPASLRSTASRIARSIPRTGSTLPYCLHDTHLTM